MSYLDAVKKVFLDSRAIASTEVLAMSEVDIVHASNMLQVKNIVSDVNLATSEHVCKMGNDVLNDVEFFKCFTDRNTTTIFDKINFCQLQGSQLLLRNIVETPLYDPTFLTSRQDILKTIEQSFDHEHDVYTALKVDESTVLWLFEDVEPNLKEMYDMVFFKFCLLKPLNNKPSAITVSNLYRILASPLIGIFTPIMYFIVPYLVIVYKLKLKISFGAYLKIILRTMVESGGVGNIGGNSKFFRYVSYIFSIIFYFQGIFNSIEISKTVYRISKHIVNKVNTIVRFIKDAHSKNLKFWTDDITKYFLTMTGLKTLEEETFYIDKLDVNDFSLTSNFGRQLHTYLTFDKDVIKSILVKSYIIEALQSIVLFKQHYGIDYVNYISDSELPIIKVCEVFHPCIDKDKVVANMVNIGADHKNMILTGPNAGGKSTFIKSLIVNTILCQTVGVCMAKTCSMTPFYIINSQINIPDSKGYESLFEAEMYRCKEKLDLIKHCDQSKFALFIMDEIFNSTNPVEGIAGAYAIANKLSEYKNSILIFTTHFLYLTKLKRNGRFVNYKMNVEKKDENIYYPYKLFNGVSKQYIALDLLDKNGFDKDIIEQAQTIKAKFTR